MGLVALIAIVIVGVLVVGGGIVGGMVWGVRNPLQSGSETKAIKGADGKPTKVIGARKEPKALPGDQGLSYLDPEAGATGDDIKAVLAPYREDEVVGSHAGCTYTALDRTEFTRTAIVRLMEREFGRESLTWERYSAPVESALSNIYSNSARIANIVQALDSGEYQRLQRLEKAGQLAADGQDARRLDAMTSQLHEAHDLVYDNEAMLAELGRLQTELARLADSHQAVTADEIAEEVRNLADRTREYMPNQAADISSVPGVATNPADAVADDATAGGCDPLADALSEMGFVEEGEPSGGSLDDSADGSGNADNGGFSMDDIEGLWS